MTTATTTPTKTTTRADVSRMLDKMRSLRISLAAKLVQRDRAIEAVNQRYAEVIAGDDAQLLQLDAAVCRWAVDNRISEFGEAKSMVFPSGASVQFRWKPKSFAFDFGWIEAKVLQALKRRKLAKFIRITEAIDKAALIKAVGDSITPKQAKSFGVVINQEETVSITIPLATAGKEKAA